MVMGSFPVPGFALIDDVFFDREGKASLANIRVGTMHLDRAQQ
jgi:hypothetical protein